MTPVDSRVRFRPLRFGWAEMRSAAEHPAAEIVLAGAPAIGRNQEAADRRCHRVRLTAGTARPGARQRGPLTGLKSGVLILSSIPALASAQSDDSGVPMAEQGLPVPADGSGSEPGSGMVLVRVPAGWHLLLPGQ